MRLLRALLTWAFLVLCGWAVVEGFARAWDHEYQAAAYRRGR